MNHFQYKDGVLCAEGVRLDLLAEKVGTPFYCYSTATFARHYKVFVEAVLDKVEGRRLTFHVNVNDPRGLVATGRVTRVVVETERFLEKSR